MICTICISKIKKKESIVKLRCKHSFHLPCYTELMTTCEQNSKCPVCRTSTEKISIVDEIKKNNEKHKVEIEHLELKINDLNDYINRLESENITTRNHAIAMLASYDKKVCECALLETQYNIERNNRKRYEIQVSHLKNTMELLTHQLKNLHSAYNDIKRTFDLNVNNMY